MISSLCAAFFSKARYGTPMCLLVSLSIATDVRGQDNEIVTVPSVFYSYLSEEKDSEGNHIKKFFDLKELSDQISELGLSSESALAINASEEDGYRSLNEDAFINALRQSDNPGLEALGDSLGYFEDEELNGGGVQAAAAIEMLTVSDIGAEKCKALPPAPPDLGNPNNKWEIYKTAILGRCSMTAVQYAFDQDANEGLGRGQFDIRTTKFVLCRNLLTNDIEGIPINVRWVFNVNGQSLKVEESGGFSNPPPNGGSYQQRFIARGTGIQLVLMQIDGTALPPNNPAYLIVGNACIDIWFVDKVNGFDISVPASLPNAGVFCAGGYCKGVPPGLDATR
jgi:hypothetical protein